MFDGLIRLWSKKRKKKRLVTPVPRNTAHFSKRNSVTRGDVEKTGIGGNKAKNDENGSVFLRTWWPDTDKFWGRGTNVSQRRHCASFIRAGEAQRGRRKKKVIVSFPCRRFLVTFFGTRAPNERSRESRMTRSTDFTSRSFRIFCTIAYALHEFSRPFFNVIGVPDWSNRKVV